MRVEVNWDLCDGQGACQEQAPEVFRLGEDDTVQLLQPEPPESLRDKVAAAVKACPKAALSLNAL